VTRTPRRTATRVTLKVIQHTNTRAKVIDRSTAASVLLRGVSNTGVAPMRGGGGGALSNGFLLRFETFPPLERNK